MGELMALETPTTSQISNNIVAQIQASLNQSIPLLPKSFIRVLSKVLAGVFILLYKYGGFAHLQMFVSTASTKETEINGQKLIPIIEWGRLVGVGDPIAATNAELQVTITVENQTGSIQSGSQLIGAINGVTYITVGSILLNATTVTGTIIAVSDQAGGGGSGTIGNLDVGAVISFANPLANIARDTVVLAQTVTAAEAEDMEAYRQRVLDRFQKLPQGGAYADYEQWGESTAGIANVYPYTSTFPGQVDVYVEAKDTVDGIPTLAQLQAVLDSIELDDNGLATRRPANALVNAFPITRVVFNVRVTGLSVPDLAQTRSDISAALTNYFLDREPYIVGLSIPPRKDRITRSSVSGIVDDIVNATGGIFTSAFISVGGINTDLYTLGVGEKAKIGTLSWV